jgi:flagellin-like protein
MNYRKFRKNAKALSPVVASIILIAVTVAVSVVVAAWMGGMTINLMGTAEQGVITNLEFDASGNTITATVQNTGDVAITITGGFINGNSATTDVGSGLQIAKGGTDTVVLDVPVALQPLTDAQQYQVKLSTAKGNSIAYTQTYSAP